MDASDQNKNPASTRPLAFALGIIGIGLCALAVALYFFTMEMAAWRNEIPELSANIDKIMDRVPETVEKVDSIRESSP